MTDSLKNSKKYSVYSWRLCNMAII